MDAWAVSQVLHRMEGWVVSQVLRCKEAWAVSRVLLHKDPFIERPLEKIIQPSGWYETPLANSLEEPKV
jgi:hypothetical protein